MTETIPYSFTRYFESVFKERTGLELSEDVRAEIMANIKNITPHKKVDNKGRYSEYFTFLLCNELITFVCDAHTHKVITCVKETHHDVNFYKK